MTGFTACSFVKSKAHLLESCFGACLVIFKFIFQFRQCWDLFSKNMKLKYVLKDAERLEFVQTKTTSSNCIAYELCES